MSLSDDPAALHAQRRIENLTFTHLGPCDVYHYNTTMLCKSLYLICDSRKCGIKVFHGEFKLHSNPICLNMLLVPLRFFFLGCFRILLVPLSIYRFIQEVESSMGPGKQCQLRTFLTYYINELFLNQVRTETNKDIETVTKVADPLKILASADTMKNLGVQRPLLQVDFHMSTL